MKFPDVIHFNINVFNLGMYCLTREKLLVSHRAPPQVADRERSPDMVGTGEIK